MAAQCTLRLAAIVLVVFMPSLLVGEDDPGLVAMLEFDELTEQDYPKGWAQQRLDGDEKRVPSKYAVVDTEEGKALKGEADKSASILYRRIRIDPKEYPYLVWRWKVDQVYDNPKERSKSGDDFPARIYVGFKYVPAQHGLLTRAKFRWARARSERGVYPPAWMLNYVWASKLEKNTWHPNPWQERAKLVVVESGAERTGAWRTEIRHYYEDFKAIVGEEPPEVETVGVMIDGDDTGSQGTFLVSRIEFRKVPSPDLEDEVPPTPKKHTE